MNTRSSLIRALRRPAGVAGIGACALALMLAPPAGAQAPLLTLPDVPWFIGQNVPPNILLTLDDSGSMVWGYSPDGFSNAATAPGVDHIAFKSTLNPMYYNPAVTYTPPANAAGVPYPTSYTAARRNGFDPSRGTVDLSTQYRPEHSYAPHTTAGSLAAHCTTTAEYYTGSVCRVIAIPPGANTSAYWWTYTAGAPGCPVAPTLLQMRTLPMGCFALGQPTTAEQRQNFANWYSFYRTRNLATVSAAMLGFSQLPSDYRIAWQALNTCNSPVQFSAACKGWQTTRPTVNARLGTFDTEKRAELWTWLERLPAAGGTPLRSALERAGEYLKTTGPLSPYANVPGSHTSGTTSCRASYNVMMTDGVWNSDSPTVAGNADNSTKTLPDGKVYSPAAPFRDTNSNSLADLAFHYWAQDLQPGLANTLRPFLPYQAGPVLTPSEYWDPRNDPGTWQRMTTITVGLGLTSWLTAPPWMGSTFAGGTAPPTGYQAFRTGTAWPSIGADAGRVYDLWHAAINSRGHFYSVDSPDTLVKAFEDLRNRISQREAGVSAAAGSSLQVQTDSMMYSTSFNSQRWDGTLRAFRIQPDGVAEPFPAWTTDQTFNHLAPGQIGPHKVLARGAGTTLVPFNPATLSQLPAARRAELQAQAAVLFSLPPTATLAERQAAENELVRWVLGDTANTDLKRRDRLLGDLINSAPLYEGARDYGYGVTSWTDTPPIDGKVYADYLKRKKGGAGPAGPKPTVYVGANDGMLHAFDARTGAHRFAYLPSPAIAKLGRRADPLAGHTWFVDGPITTHDVHNGTEWRTLLIASTGAGSRGLFALDVTDPDAPILLWEWFPDDPDLGHVLGEAVVARAQSGQWIVAVGNGYGNLSNKAVLFVLDALTGAPLRRLEAGAPEAGVANGLSAPALLYLSGRQLGFAYSGDLRGRLWRFDLRGAPESWSLSFAGQPIFQASGPTGEAQAITAKPRIASDRTLGRMILFGTGRLLTAQDRADTAVQTLYGVQDRASGSTGTRADLTQQTILSEAAGNRTLSANAPSASDKGWYVDLTGTPTSTGERVVMPMSYLPEASMVLVSTTRPVATNDPCAAEVSSWMMAFSPFSGRGLELFAPVAGDQRRAGQQLDGLVAPPTALRKDNSTLRLIVNAGSSGLGQWEVPGNFNPRTSWQQIR